jgi:hypothetical protein
MEEELHRANVVVPAGVAAILDAQPSLLAPAAHAFLERDAIDMKASSSSKRALRGHIAIEDPHQGAA